MLAPQTGSPMTYRRAGRQYLIVPIGSAQYGAEFVAFRLPAPPAPGRGRGLSLVAGASLGAVARCAR